MDCILYYTHIVSVLLSLVTHQCTASDLNHNTILDIDDYQFHFSTYHYEFSTIQPLSATIKHPFEDHLNITLDIDLNSTVSLSFNDNLTLDFLNIDDFREITYASLLQHTPTPSPRRSLLAQFPHPKVINADLNTINQAFTQQAKNARNQGTADKQTQDQAMGQTPKGAKDASGNVFMGKDEAALESEVSRAIHKQVMQNSNNEWRNRMFDQSMGNGPHPGFPTMDEFMKYHAFNQRPPPAPGMDPEYDAYKKMRDQALHRADGLYDKFHENGGIALHDRNSLMKRYEKPKKGPRYVVEQNKTPRPVPTVPRKVPYHHGKYIGIPHRKSWFMAQQYCREQFGTNLASVMTEDDLKEIRQVCDEVASYGHCWMGLRRPFGTWQDGKPVQMSNWGASGVNNNHEIPLNCVELMYTDNQWNAQLCTVYRPFVCEEPRKRTRGKYIAVGKALSWESAENYCQTTYDTDLATIVNEVENHLATNLCRDISSDMHHCWIGLYAPYHLWTDGTRAKRYKNFINKPPNIGYTPDHKGEEVHENSEEEPEPYGEDDEGNYPAKAIRLDMINDLNLQSSIQRDVDRLSTRVKEHELEHAGPPGAEEEINEGDFNAQPSQGRTPHKQYEQEGAKRMKGKDAWRKKKEKMREEALTRYDREEAREKAEAAKKGQTVEEEERDKGKCVEINTSYGGIWDKARCSFRHFFLCNNPAFPQNTMTQQQEPQDEEYPLARFTKKRRKSPRYRKKKRKRKRRRRREEREMRDEMRREEQGQTEQQEEAETYRRRLYDEMEGDMEGKWGAKLKGLGKKAKGLWGKHGAKISGMAGKLAGKLFKKDKYGGRGDARDMRNKRGAWRREHEGNSRWKRRERRRRRRRSRRRRFMRWLKVHYGTGDKRTCAPPCPHRHVRIRVLPKDMHWNPMSGLLPLLGAPVHPKKAPKIQIVAKVHLPKHRPIEGDLDYDLVNALLFNNGAKKAGLMGTFDKKEKKVEKLIAGQQGKNLLNAFDQANGLQKEKTYSKWDQENDDRMSQQRDRRRMLMDNAWEEGVYMVSHCRIVRDADEECYELCVSYDAMEKVISVDVKSLEYKIRKEYKRKVFRDVMDINGMHYKDYRILEEEGKELERVGEYGLFEPIDGNLGYAIFKYESLDWHSVQEYENEWRGNKHEYGDFENFEHWIRFNQRFDVVFDGRNDDECSVTLDGLPFKMCIKNEDGMVLYFEKDASMDVLDPVFSFRMKEFIDKEFEESMFVFSDDTLWDEVNVINMEEYIEKCSYLHIAKVCMTRNNANGSITAYISFQFMNKAMPLLKETKRIMMSNVFDLLQNNAWQYDLILNTSHRASFVPLYLNIEEHILSNKTQWSRNHYNDDLLSCTIDVSSLCLIQTRSSLILSYNNHLYHFTNHTQWSYSNQISIIPQHPENRRR
eukprot:1033209_1